MERSAYYPKDFAIFQPQGQYIFCQKFHLKNPRKSQKKSKYRKSYTCVSRFYVSEGADQIWGNLEHLLAQFFKKKKCKNLEANFDDFPIQIDENGPERLNFGGSYLSNRWELRGK